MARAFIRGVLCSFISLCGQFRITAAGKEQLIPMPLAGRQILRKLPNGLYANRAGAPVRRPYSFIIYILNDIYWLSNGRTDPSRRAPAAALFEDDSGGWSVSFAWYSALASLLTPHSSFLISHLWRRRRQPVRGARGTCAHGARAIQRRYFHSPHSTLPDPSNASTNIFSKTASIGPFWCVYIHAGHKTKPGRHNQRIKKKSKEII